MYENQTYEVIKKQILDSITVDIDKREGSFINDMVSPIAVELTRAYMEFTNILNIAFLDTSYDTYLDRKVNEFGVSRKEGEKATGYVTISGTSGTVIPVDTVVISENGLRFILETGIIRDGTISLIATAEKVGKEYNIIANNISKIEIDIFGVNSIDNGIFTGGIDRETDDELKKRFFNVIRRPSTSGNKNHYEKWALEVNGIGNVIVKPLWGGPGTIKVLVSDSNKEPVSEDVLNNCKAHIESVRPIGATVTVETPSLFNISINVDVDLDNTLTLEEVRELIYKNLINYFKTCDTTIIYTKVGGIIASTLGVTDYRELTINNSEVNIEIAAESIVSLEGLVVR